jgi:chromate reductase
MADIKVLTLVGSLRAASVNRQLAELAAEAAPDGITLNIYEGLGDLPFYNEDIDTEDAPAAVVALRAAAAEADAALVVTPEYNATIPGVLKNAIDWLSRMTPQPFAAKPIAMFGASGGALGTARAQYQLRQTFVFLDGRPVNKPEVMIGAAQNRFADGKLTDEATGKLLADLGASLALAVRQARAAANVK